jgi:hypothetical protein
MHMNHSPGCSSAELRRAFVLLRFADLNIFETQTINLRHFVLIV